MSLVLRNDAGQKISCNCLVQCIPEHKQQWRKPCGVNEGCCAEGFVPLLSYSLFQKINRNGEMSVLLMNDAGQKISCHYYAILYTRVKAALEKLLRC